MGGQCSHCQMGRPSGQWILHPQRSCNANTSKFKILVPSPVSTQIQRNVSLNLKMWRKASKLMVILFFWCVCWWCACTWSNGRLEVHCRTAQWKMRSDLFCNLWTHQESRPLLCGSPTSAFMTAAPRITLSVIIAAFGVKKVSAASTISTSHWVFLCLILTARCSKAIRSPNQMLTF